MSEHTGTAASDAKEGRFGTTPSRVSVLDQTLWHRFSEASTLEAFIQAWIGIQSRMVGGVSSGVALLGAPPDGPFVPAAFWPDQEACGDNLRTVAEQVIAERRAVVSRAADAASNVHYIGCPFEIDGELYGGVVLELTGESASQLSAAVRQLHWGSHAVEARLRREQGKAREAHVHRMATAFDILALAVSQTTFRGASNAVATELATRLGCELVSVGFVRRGRTKVAALSHAPQFGKRMDLVRAVEAAMDEAIDQEAVIAFPEHAGWSYRISRAHAELIQVHNAGSAVTIPVQANGSFFGAITFERANALDEETVELCDCVASMVGPILEEKRRNDRLILAKIWDSVSTQAKRLLGPHYLGRKLATAAAIAIIAFFSVATDENRIPSPAVVEGGIQRVLVSAIDGYVASEHARAGQVVSKGAILAKLDDRDLVLERLRAITERNSRSIEYDRALAARERAKALILQTDIERAEAQIALMNAQIERAKIEAPFDGLVISGDLSQSIGAPVRRGEELFKLAPLDSYRVILKVDERDIADVVIGQRGRLISSAVPDMTFDYTVSRVTPIAESAEGRNFFKVEATLDQTDARLRPGMTGIAKTNAGERLLIRIWTDRLVDWIRLTLWRWLP